MFIRPLAVVTVSLGLTLGLTSLLVAQSQDDHPTARQLYEQGVAALQAGNQDQARQLLRRVDPMQLPRSERRAYYQALERLDLGQAQPAPAAETPAQPAAPESAASTPASSESSAGQAAPSQEAEPVVEELPIQTAPAGGTVSAAQPAPPTAEQRLAQADAMAGSQPSRAAAAYRDLVNDPDVSADVQDRAAARLAQVQRSANRELTAARSLIEEGIAAYRAGNTAEAQAKLQAVDNSNVDLGWFDRERLDQALAAVNSASMEPAEASQPAAPESQGPQMAVAEPVEVETIQPQPSTEPAPQPEKPQPQPRTVAQAESNMMAQPEPAPARESAPAPAAGPRPATAQPMDAQAQPMQSAQPERTPRPQMAAPATDSGVMARVRQSAVQQYLAEAQQAMNNGQYELAAFHLNKAQQLDPGNPDATQMLARVQAREQGAAGAQGPIQRQIQETEVRRGRVIAEYDAYIAEANRLAAQNNYAAASQAATQALAVIQQNANLFDADEAQRRRSDAAQLQDRIQVAQRQFDAEREQAAETERLATEERERREALTQRQEQVNDLLLRSRALQRDMKYDEALELVEQALFLEPNNLAAQLLKEMLVDTRILIQAKDYLRDRSVALAEQSVQSIEATIPYPDLVTYPSNWPQLTRDRLAQVDPEAGESEPNRRARLKLREPIPTRFNGDRLEAVIDFFRTSTSVNFDVRWNQLETAGVDRDTPITLSLENVPAEEALRRVLQQVSTEFDPVSFSVIEGIVTISTQRDLQQTTVIRSYDIRDLLLVPVNGYDNAPEFDLTEALGDGGSGGNGGGGGGGGNLFGDDNNDDDDEEEEQQQIIDDIMTLIQDTIGRQEEWVVYGGDISRVDEINGQLIVRTTPENHREIIDLLSQLRETRSIMISVEGRFLVVNDNFLEEVGIDLDMQIDTGGNFGPLKIANDTASLAQRVPSALTPERFSVTSNSTGVGTMPSPGTFNPVDGYPALGRSLNLGISYIDDLSVNLLIQATQANQRSLSLTAPRVTFANGYGAFVAVARQIAFVSDLEVVPDAIGFDPEVSVLNTGVVLSVEGAASADRRYVTLNIRPQLARLDEFNDYTQVGSANLNNGTDDDDTTVVIQGTFSLPTIELTDLETTVSIPDRGTLLLGGQRLVEEIEIEAGVPVLSKIPVLNRLFTNTSTVKDERTLLILVKPTIIIQNEEEEALFPGLLQDVNSYNTGRGY